MKTWSNRCHTYDDGVRVSGTLKVIITGLMLSLSVILVACGGNPSATESEVEQGASGVATEAAEIDEEVERGIDVVEEEATETLGEVQQGTVVLEEELTQVAEEMQQGAETLEEEAVELAEDVQSVSLNDMMTRVEEYLDQTIAVSGTVSEIYGEQVFSLSDPTNITGEHLLVASLDQPAGVVEDEMVQVVGDVRDIDRSTLETELGYQVDDILGNFTDDTVLVAQSISRLGQGEQITLSDLADTPNMYEGTTVTVTGEVSEQVAPNVVRVDEDNILDIGDEILVVYDAEATTMNLGEDTEIRVTGIVTRFVVAELRDYVDPELFPDLYVDYERRPTILAESIMVTETEE